MPATITHSLFSKDVYNNLDNDIKNSIIGEEKSLIMFSQSTDPLMFYNIMSIKKGKHIRKLQFIYHKDISEEFFDDLIKYIKKNKYYDNPQVLSFLYGLVLHYCLDSTIHPYVYYKTGLFDKKNKETYKYNCKHHFMETYIDNYMLKKKGYKYFNISKECFDLHPFSTKLGSTIDYIFSKRYHVDSFSKDYYKSLHDMRLFIKLFRTDTFGIKRIIYKTIDMFTPKSFFILESLSYNSNYNYNDYLNEQHKVWKNPWNESITSSKNYDELYDSAMQDALNIIKDLHSYFFKDKKINIPKLFKNKNHLGLDDNKKDNELVFEF